MNSDDSVAKHGRAELFGSADFEASDVVEISVEQGRAVKAVVRFPYSDSMDLCMVLNRPVAGKAFVRTVWFNEVNDKHNTLRLGRFARPVAGVKVL